MGPIARTQSASIAARKILPGPYKRTQYKIYRDEFFVLVVIVGRFARTPGIYDDDRVEIFFLVRTICVCMCTSSRFSSHRIFMRCTCTFIFGARRIQMDDFLDGRDEKSEGLWVNRCARIVAFVSGIFGFVRSTSCELQNVEEFYVYMSEVKLTIFIEINSLRSKSVQEILLSYWTSTVICGICN